MILDLDFYNLSVDEINIDFVRLGVDIQLTITAADCFRAEYRCPLLLQPLHPPPPSLPLVPPKSSFTSLISNHSNFDIPPPILFPIPPRFPHQTHYRLFLRPPLLNCYVRKVSSTVPFPMVGEGDTDPVGSEIPVEGVGGGLEVCQEGDAVGEGVEFRTRYGAEARIVKGTGCSRSVNNSMICALRGPGEGGMYTYAVSA